MAGVQSTAKLIIPEKVISEAATAEDYHPETTTATSKDQAYINKLKRAFKSRFLNNMKIELTEGGTKTPPSPPPSPASTRPSTPINDDDDNYLTSFGFSDSLGIRILQCVLFIFGIYPNREEIHEIEEITDDRRIIRILQSYPNDDEYMTISQRNQIQYDHLLFYWIEKSKSIMEFMERIVCWDKPKETAGYFFGLNMLYTISIIHLYGSAAAGSAALGLVVSVLLSAIMFIQNEQPEHMSIRRRKMDNSKNVSNCDRADGSLNVASKKNVLLMSDESKQGERISPIEIIPIVFPLLVVFTYLIFILFSPDFPYFYVYVLLAKVFVAPVAFYYFYNKLSNTDMDGEIKEYLPDATESNLEALTSASERGKYSPTPSKSENGNYSDDDEDDDLEGLNMPSHEEGSSDELSDIELNPDDIAQIKRRRLDHDVLSSDFSSSDASSFGSEPGSPKATVGKDLSVKNLTWKGPSDTESDSSDDSDFEIIDDKDLEELKNL